LITMWKLMIMKYKLLSKRFQSLTENENKE